jgi:hypothetical protein
LRISAADEGVRMVLVYVACVWKSLLYKYIGMYSLKTCV